MKVSLKINSYDIETKIINDLYIGFCVVFNFSNTFYNFYGCESIKNSINKLLDISNKNITHVLYVHNLNFDGFLIIEALSKMNCVMMIKGFNSNLYYIRIVDNDKIIEWRCSYRLVPLSLKNIAIKWLNTDKLPFPYKILNTDFNNDYIFNKNDFNDINEFERWKSLNLNLNIEEYTIEYCMRDVLITKLFVQKFWSVMKLFNISINSRLYSLPSISVKIFFDQYNIFNVSKKINKVLDRYVRRAYYGGRCEVFGNSELNEYVFHYDFKGMYAQCMLDDYPADNGQIVFNILKIEKFGFYDIDWEYEGFMPILPIKDSATSKLMFYAGRGRGVYWYEEILLHIANGGKVIKIYSALIFDRVDKIFNNYIMRTNEIREMGDVYKDIGKLLANSMYGRLGMGRENTMTHITTNIDDVYKFIKYRKLNNIYIGEIVLNSEFMGISNVILASIITSKARIKLYKAFLDVEKNFGRVLYCDTDSIIAAYKENVIDEWHGCIHWDSKKQDTIIINSCFAQPKTYSIIFKNGDWVTKIKGFKRNHFSFNKFNTAFKNNEIIVDNMSISIKKHNYILESDTNIKKIDLSIYSKRIWSKERTHTIPFRIE